MKQAQVWGGLSRLYEMLMDGVIAEREYQRFFEDNVWVFEALGFDRFASFEKQSGNRLPYDYERNYQPEPDFIIGNSKTGEVCIFELKTPESVSPTTSRSTDGNREKLKSVLESYVSQCSEYIAFISGDVAARRAVCSILDMPGVSTVSAKLIYGLHFEDAAAVARLAATRVPRIEIVDFTSLLARLVSAFGVGRDDVVPVPGLSVCMSLVIAPDQVNSPAYVCDMGSIGHNRLSLVVVGGETKIIIVDDHGRNLEFYTHVGANEVSFIRLEIASVPDNNSIRIFVNSQEVESISSIKPLELELDLTKFTLGADLNGNHAVCCKIAEYLILEAVMDLAAGVIHLVSDEHLPQAVSV